MRTTKLLFLLLGVALFAWLMTHVELDAVTREIAALGVVGFALVLAVYALEFLCDVLAWQLTLDGIPASARWAARLFGVRAAGEAYNVITPLAGMGGEPVKALILKRRYAVDYSRAGASLILARTANVLALVLFLAVGFALMLGDSRIGGELRWLAGVGLASLSLGIGAFVVLQRLRLASRLGARLARISHSSESRDDASARDREPSRPRSARAYSTARPALRPMEDPSDGDSAVPPHEEVEKGGLRVSAALAGLEAFDRQLVAFYTRDPVRFATVLGLGITNWVLGALGVWLTMWLMGRPVLFVDAWIIEAMVQMVRAATFFIPASLGAQEGVLMVVLGAISGDVTSGFALALVRRGRELVWVAGGLVASVRYLGGLPRRVELD